MGIVLWPPPSTPNQWVANVKKFELGERPERSLKPGLLNILFGLSKVPRTQFEADFLVWQSLKAKGKL